MKRNQPKAQVAIVMGSTSDTECLKGCGAVLREFGIPYIAKVLSAHRTPKETAEFAESAESKGIEVIIAAAGGAAHLAGVVAAHTDLPVIGIPVESKSLKGLDSLLSTVQMPPGVPVACVAIGPGGAKNAAYLAIRILALKHSKFREKIKAFKTEMRSKILSSKPDL